MLCEREQFGHFESVLESVSSVCSNSDQWNFQTRLRSKLKMNAAFLPLPCVALSPCTFIHYSSPSCVVSTPRDFCPTSPSLFPISSLRLFSPSHQPSSSRFLHPLCGLQSVITNVSVRVLFSCSKFKIFWMSFCCCRRESGSCTIYCLQTQMATPAKKASPFCTSIDDWLRERDSFRQTRSSTAGWKPLPGSHSFLYY